MANHHGPDTSENREDLLELDLDTAPSKLSTNQAPKAAPAITKPAPVVSPLAAGQALIDGCVTFPELQQLAGRFNDAKSVDGKWFASLPDATKEQIRLAWRARRHMFLLAVLRRVWATLWGFFATANLRGNSEAPEVLAVLAEPVAPPQPASEASSLVEALGNVSHESQTNAATQASGSLAAGSMRYVGFSTAAGYVQALANGVKAATAESYKNTLRSQYKYTAEQIAALTVTIIPEHTGLVGKGIVHTPTIDTTNLRGDALRKVWNDAQKTDSAKAAEAKAAAEKAEQDAEKERVLIAGLVATREGLCISPGEAQKGFKIPAAAFRAALGEKFSHLAPNIRTDKAQFGEVMRSLRGNGLVTFSITKSHTDTDWPADVVTRYSVGRLDGSTNLDTMGPKVLVADLCKVSTDEAGNKLPKPYYEIRFTGGEEDVRERVKAEFERRTTGELLTTTYLGQWLKNNVLRKEYHAIKWGGFWFVPGDEQHTAPLTELLTLLVEGTDGTSLIGRDVGVGSTTTNSRWSRGIARTLLADLARIVKAFDGNIAAAQKRAREAAIEEKLDEAGQELAVRRAKASPEAAHGRLKELQKLTTMIEGYKALIGDEYETVIAQIRTLRTAVEDCMDDTSLRAANLELDLDNEDDGDNAAPASPYADEDSGSVLELD